MTRRGKKTAPKKILLVGTLDAWATGLGRERRTLERLLVKNGIEVQPRKIYSAVQIFAGLVGDEQAERTRNLKLDADEKERNAKITSGELVDWETLLTMLNNKFINPTIAALDTCKDREWVTGVLLPILKQSIEPPKKTP